MYINVYKCIYVCVCVRVYLVVYYVCVKFNHALVAL